MYVVKGDTGNAHVVTLRRNKKHTCTCEGNAVWKRQCYHIKHCVIDANTCHAAKVAATKPVVAQQVIETPAQPVVVTPNVAEPQYHIMSPDVYAKLASLSEEKPVEAVEETQSVPEVVVASPVITEEASDLDIEQEIARQLSLLKSAKIDSLRYIAFKRGINVKSRTRKGLIDAIIASAREKLESKQKEIIAA